MHSNNSATTVSVQANNRPSTENRERRLRAQLKKQREKAAKYANYLGQTLTRAERAEEEVETLRRRLAHAQRSLTVKVKTTSN